MPELKIAYYIQTPGNTNLIGPYGERRYAEEVLHKGDKIVKRKIKKKT